MCCSRLRNDPGRLALIVQYTATRQDHSASESVVPDSHAELKHMIEHAAHFLPAQKPISAFVHHNTLHAFEDLPFREAVQEGAKLYGAHPYLPEELYRKQFKRGRILREDLAEVLLDDLGDDADTLVALLGTRYNLRLAMIPHPVQFGSDAELRWLLAETDALRRFREDTSLEIRTAMIRETRHLVMRDFRNSDRPPKSEIERRVKETLELVFLRFDSSKMEYWEDETWEAFCLQLLWEVCRAGVRGIQRDSRKPSVPVVRHRDWLLEVTGEDTDLVVHELLIMFCAAYLDQGISNWILPRREEGFLAAFCEMYRQPGGPPNHWLRGLREILDDISERRVSSLASIEKSLDTLGVAREDREVYIQKTLLALRGWAGMIWQTETQTDRVVNPSKPGSLIDFLAVRLILDQLALKDVAKTRLGFKGPLSELMQTLSSRHNRTAGPSVDQQAFVVFQIAQILGWKPMGLFPISNSQWGQVQSEIESFSSIERRRIYQLAFERRYRIETLDAIVIRNRKQLPAPPPTKFQIVCCIDEREESFRRHLEELCPEAETLGAAGFFSVAMYYRGAADAHYIPLCPVVITPKHYVREVVRDSHEHVHNLRERWRRWIATASFRIHRGSRGFALGALLASILGPLASFPLVLRVLFPRFTAQMRKMAGQYVEPPPATKLLIERTTVEPGESTGQIGYSIPEMADIVDRLLTDVGLLGRMSRLVIIAGHGSSSLNNPHESAYNCGACGGARGGPNARAVAQMANDSRVRDLLRQRGLLIPNDTVFLGAYHNTCDDSMLYFDLDQLPRSHKDDLEFARDAIDGARARNAHERCRRFESAPLNLSLDAALRHVESRSEDLAQVRPEYCHASNAVCFVGRRCRTRALFMDRRSFLVSYDPLSDTDGGKILTRILQAAIPVCAGINLEYFFSNIDSNNWGCGTKLPHNIASLIGVMDGAASDLRTGLSSQMVEIHEPLRLLFIIETKPDVMQHIMDANAEIRRLCRNEWVQLSVLDPDSSTIHHFRNGQFETYQPAKRELPEVERSIDWYRGWRDHLGYAIVIPSNEMAHSNGIAKRPSAKEE